MQNPIQFFKDIKTDILVAFDPPSDEPKDIQNSRIASIALRIFGSIIALSTAFYFLCKVSLIAGSPAAALALLVATSIGIILAHDLIQTGYNQHKMISLTNPLPKESDILTTGGQLFTGIQEIVGAVIKEQLTGTPTSLQDTWLFEPVYQLFESCTNKQNNEQ